MPDALDEANETVIVDITGVTNGTETGTQQVTTTITDDDAPPAVTLGVDQITMAENSGVATVTASLSAVSGLPVTVDLALSGSATGGGTDYTASGTQIVIAAGALSGSVMVTGVDDLLDEPDETVIVDITAVTNGIESGIQQVTVTIVDDEGTPTVQFTVAAQANLENVTLVTATVQLSAVSGQDVTVPFTVGGTATGDGADYSLTASPVVITAGNTTATITITVVDDALDEADETVVLTLGAPTNADLGATTVHTVTITDNDP